MDALCIGSANVIVQKLLAYSSETSDVIDTDYSNYAHKDLICVVDQGCFVWAVSFFFCTI